MDPCTRGTNQNVYRAYSLWSCRNQYYKIAYSEQFKKNRSLITKKIVIYVNFYTEAALLRENEKKTFFGFLKKTNVPKIL